MKNLNYIIFTDLDGTLLDHDTYQYSEAKPALELIQKLQIPLILTSSKTKIEMQGYQKSLGIDMYPFIVENGSAVYTTNNYFQNVTPGESDKIFDCFMLGKKYSEIVKILKDISQEYSYLIQGFHNSEKEEIISKTNLSPEAVDFAMQREFSVPLFYDEKAKNILQAEVKKYNLQMLFGGRFMHLLGKTDKGKALDLVYKGISKKYNFSNIKTIAIGDTLNDEAMLKAADVSILVKRYNNEHDKRVQIDNLIYSPYIGPKGWNHTILEILTSGVLNE